MTTYLLDLRVNTIYRAEPRPGERLRVVQHEWRGFLIFRVLIFWYNDDSEPMIIFMSIPHKTTLFEDLLRMLEHWTALVEQQVNAEFDSAFDDPAKRTIVMICDIIDEKWIVEAVGKYSRERRLRSWRPVGLLERSPCFFETERFMLRAPSRSDSKIEGG